MADEKVNASPEEKKAPEAPAPSGPGDPPAPEHTEGPAVPGGDQTAPAHVEPAMPEKTEGPIKPEQSVIPGMGEDAPAPSGKVINLSDIQAADKGGKEASTTAPEKNVFCQVLFPEKSVEIPFFQQGIFPAFSGHYASLRMRACSIR